MKKLLIISYFAPPSNLTGATRIKGWMRHLPVNGFYPIVLTRNWTGKELTLRQQMASSGSSLRIEKNEDGEIHYLPYKASWRDELFIKSQGNKLLGMLSKVATLFILIFKNYSIHFIPFNNIYKHAVELLTADKTIQHVIISGNLFEQFYFGYLLKKKFPHIKWVADYRDHWNTVEYLKKKFFISTLETISEKKWVGTASLITSVSPYYTEKISRFVNVKGETIMNGFEEIINHTLQPAANKFLIVYSGNLYGQQPVEIFIEGFKQFVTENPNENIELNFAGIEADTAAKRRVDKALKGFEKFYQTSDRISRAAIINLQQQADLLLMIGFPNQKGIPASKIYEYMSLKKHFIICPSDKDILEEIGLQSTLGILLNSSKNVYEYLKNNFAEKQQGKLLPTVEDTCVIPFSAAEQVKKLAKVLNKL